MHGSTLLVKIFQHRHRVETAWTKHPMSARQRTSLVARTVLFRSLMLLWKPAASKHHFQKVRRSGPGGAARVCGCAHTARAAHGKYVDAISHLLSHGADVHARDLEGKTALDLAHASKNDVAAELISSVMQHRRQSLRPGNRARKTLRRAGRGGLSVQAEAVRHRASRRTTPSPGGSRGLRCARPGPDASRCLGGVAYVGSQDIASC
jgi:hypothetical protein